MKAAAAISDFSVSHFLRISKIGFRISLSCLVLLLGCRTPQKPAALAPMGDSIQSAHCSGGRSGVPAATESAVTTPGSNQPIQNAITVLTTSPEIKQPIPAQSATTNAVTTSPAQKDRGVDAVPTGCVSSPAAHPAATFNSISNETRQASSPNSIGVTAQYPNKPAPAPIHLSLLMTTPATPKNPPALTNSVARATPLPPSEQFQSLPLRLRHSLTPTTNSITGAYQITPDNNTPANHQFTTSGSRSLSAVAALFTGASGPQERTLQLQMTSSTPPNANKQFNPLPLPDASGDSPAPDTNPSKPIDVEPILDATADDADWRQWQLAQQRAAEKARQAERESLTQKLQQFLQPTAK
jgi:hypothetical protein